jgi:hypothetical protein
MEMAKEHWVYLLYIYGMIHAEFALLESDKHPSLLGQKCFI